MFGFIRLGDYMRILMVVFIILISAPLVLGNIYDVGFENENDWIYEGNTDKLRMDNSLVFDYSEPLPEVDCEGAVNHHNNDWIVTSGTISGKHCNVSVFSIPSGSVYLGAETLEISADVIKIDGTLSADGESSNSVGSGAKGEYNWNIDHGGGGGAGHGGSGGDGGNGRSGEGGSGGPTYGNSYDDSLTTGSVGGQSGDSQSGGKGGGGGGGRIKVFGLDLSISEGEFSVNGGEHGSDSRGGGRDGYQGTFFSDESSYHTGSYYVTTSGQNQVTTTDWFTIESIEISQSEPVGTTLKYLVSFDNRNTWKYWDFGSWRSTSLTNIDSQGMTKETIEGINWNEWLNGGFVSGKLDFAIQISSTNNGATPAINGIQINYRTNMPLTSKFSNNGRTTDFSNEENLDSLKNLTLATAQYH